MGKESQDEKEELNDVNKRSRKFLLSYLGCGMRQILSLPLALAARMAGAPKMGSDLL